MICKYIIQLFDHNVILSYYCHFVINSNVRESDNMIFQTHDFPTSLSLKPMGQLLPRHIPRPELQETSTVERDAPMNLHLLCNVHPGSLT